MVSLSDKSSSFAVGQRQTMFFFQENEIHCSFILSVGFSLFFFSRAGNHEKCAEHLSASTEVNKVIYGADSIEYGHELHKYSEVLCNARKLSEAFRTATKAEEIFRAHYGDHHELVLEIKEYLSQLQMLNSF